MHLKAALLQMDVWGKYKMDGGVLKVEANEYYVFYIEKNNGRVFFFPAKQSLEKIVKGVKVSVELNYVGSKILELLASSAGNVVSRDEILSVAWDGRVVSSNSLNQSISMLRESLELEQGQESIIITVPRWGYKINADVVSKDTVVNDEASHSYESVKIFDHVESEIAQPISPGDLISELSVNLGLTQKFDSKALKKIRRCLRFLLMPLIITLLLNITYEFSAYFLDDESPLSLQGLNGSDKVKYLIGDGDSENAMRSDLNFLAERILKLSISDEDKIIFNKMHEYYEITCIDKKNSPVFIVFHRSRINDITDEQIQGCLK